MPAGAGHRGISGYPHSEECRARIEQAIARDDDVQLQERVEAARDRVYQRAAELTEPQADEVMMAPEGEPGAGSTAGPSGQGPGAETSAGSTAGPSGESAVARTRQREDDGGAAEEDETRAHAYRRLDDFDVNAYGQLKPLGAEAAAQQFHGLPTRPSVGEPSSGPDPIGGDGPIRAPVGVGLGPKKSVDNYDRNSHCFEWEKEMQQALDSLAPHVTEVFNPGAFCKKAPRLGLIPGVVMDLTTGWDFDYATQREKALLTIDETTPAFVIMSPVCRPFCALQALSRGRRNEARYQELVEQCREYLRFCKEIAKRQVARGAWFLFEHPWSAWSWYLEEVAEMLSLPGVVCRRGSQCMFGQMTPGPDGTPTPARKNTGWMTNSACGRSGGGRLRRVPCAPAADRRQSEGCRALSERPGGCDTQRHT